MKLNFWQIIGVVLLVVGIGVWAYTKFSGSKQNPNGTRPISPTTQTTQPAARK